MSFVSNPCRYDRRSAPDTTMRPRSDRSIQADAERAASYPSRGMTGILVLSLRMRSSHFICGASVALALMRPASAAAQQTAAPPALAEAGASNFTIFLRGAPIGSEQMAVSRVPGGWMIASTGRLSAPLDIIARRVEVRYNTEWQPLSFSLDATVRGQAQQVRTV